MKHLSFILALGALFFGISCNEIPVEIGDTPVPETDKVVLLEELTGASCPNCPKGSAAVESILETFGDKVAAVAIHGDFLAQPIHGRSKYDFRNPKAKDLENWFRPFLGKPCATVDRLELDDPDQKYASVSTGQWQSMIESELRKPKQLSILMKKSYDIATRRLEIDITAIPSVKLDGNYNITIFLTESNIIDAQINGNLIIDDFKFNHVLRDIITKFDGDVLGTDLSNGSHYKKNYSYTLPNDKDGLWKPENMEIVVAIHKSSDNQRTVIQAAKAKIKN